jgi:hypothetical protein
MIGRKDETGLFRLIEDDDDDDDDETKQTEETNNIERLKMWHKRLGHLSVKQMKKLNETNHLEGLNNQDLNKKLDCDVCDAGKKATRKFYKGQTIIKTKQIGELMHTDVCGPISPTTRGGNKYFVSFIDDYSRKSWIYLIKTKDEVLNKFKELNNLLMTQYNITIKQLTSDGGGE